MNNDTNATCIDLYQPLKRLSMICSYKLRNFNYCRKCKVTKSPQWRGGPSGFRTLCNRCGLKYARNKLYKK